VNLAAMRAARADLGDYLEQACLQLDGQDDAEVTPERAAIVAGTVTSYLALAQHALERFEEAARGA
jgi:hypothetical protein